MVKHAEQLINEIKQIKTQYVSEVGKGRRVWPRSIKERVARLDEMGIPAKSVATESGIPYETIILWRYNRRHKSETGPFHEVTVARSNSVPAVRAAKRLAAPKSDGKSRISKSGTVTATDYSRTLAGMPFRSDAASGPALFAPPDPLERFQAIYAALVAQGSWLSDKVALRLAPPR